jgi:hypothetical protein
LRHLFNGLEFGTMTDVLDAGFPRLQPDVAHSVPTP